MGAITVMGVLARLGVDDEVGGMGVAARWRRPVLTKGGAGEAGSCDVKGWGSELNLTRH
jgi:hypothetical protein